MKSERALFNKTVFWNNIKRMWPIWSLAIFGGLLMVGGYASAVFERKTWNENISNYGKFTCYQFLANELPIILFLYAIVVGTGIWYYLNSHRATVFMNSIPVGRKGLFVTNYISGILMILVPQLVMLVGFFTVTLMFGLTTQGIIINSLQVIITESVIMFTLATLASVLSGTTLASIALYGVLNLFFTGLEYFFNSFAERFLYGVVINYQARLVWLSPISYLVRVLNIDTVYDDFGTGTVVTLKNQGSLWIYFVVMLLILVLAYYLNNIRRSEMASEMFAFKTVKGVIVALITCFGGLAGSSIIHGFIHNWVGGIYNVFEIIIYMIIATAISYFIIMMIVDGTIKVFSRKNVGRCSALIAVLTVIICIISIDPFGYVHEMPERDKISYVNLYGQREMFASYDDPELLDLILDVHKEVINAGGIREKRGYKDSHWLRIEYYMKDGSSLSRVYDIPIYRDNLVDRDSLESKLMEFYNNKLVSNRRYMIDRDYFEIEYAYVNAYSEEESYDYNINKAEFSGLSEALRKDIDEGNIPQENIFSTEGVEEYDEKMINLQIDYSITITNLVGNKFNTYDEFAYGQSSYQWYEITKEMKNTYDYLVNLGAVPENFY